MIVGVSVGVAVGVFVGVRLGVSEAVSVGVGVSVKVAVGGMGVKVGGTGVSVGVAVGETKLKLQADNPIAKRSIQIKSEYLGEVFMLIGVATFFRGDWFGVIIRPFFDCGEDCPRNSIGYA